MNPVIITRIEGATVSSVSSPRIVRVVPGLFVLLPTFSETSGRPVESAVPAANEAAGAASAATRPRGRARVRMRKADGMPGEVAPSVMPDSCAGVVPASNGVSARFKPGLNAHRAGRASAA